MINKKLIFSFYEDKNDNRKNEYLVCLKNNLNAFSDCLILVEIKDKVYFESLQLNLLSNQRVRYIEKRPTFNDFFEILDEVEFFNSINVICNSDIYFEETNCFDIYFQSDLKNCLALSRWDVNGDGTSSLFNRIDSQDTWVFFGNPKFRLSLDFTMGVAGCDNRLAYELEQAGFIVINPSLSIKTYHLHLTNIRNNINEVGQNIIIIPPPYKMVIPQ
jgi:hypothetical protein